jgi:beta-lactamase class A
MQMAGTAEPLTATTQQASHTLLKYLFLILILLVLCTTVLPADSLKPKNSARVLSPSAKQTTIALNGANLWQGDHITTAPTFHLSAANANTFTVDPAFSNYYASHNGSTSLGTPLTSALPTAQGLIQFFQSGALYLPKNQFHSLIETKEQPDLFKLGITDPTTGITRLPLLAELLHAGSLVPLADPDADLSYVDLRNAANPALMRPAPQTTATKLVFTLKQPIFVAAGMRAGKEVGHLIPRPIWNAINRPDISPDGWETDFGPPLTEAIPVNATEQGSVHHLLAQAFWQDGLILDQDDLDASGNPTVQRLNTGLAYLRTFGPPDVVLPSQLPLWSLGDTTVFSAPGTNQVVAHIGQNFPLATVGDTTWNAGVLWYHVLWNLPKSTGNGWVPSSAVTFTSPGNVPGWASIDALSPSLASYLASMGNNIDIVVYDLTRHRYYTYNKDMQMLTGSSIKVFIMLTLLNMTEQQGREPDAGEMSLLTSMIENSDNDAAAALYNEIGQAAGVSNFLAQIGVSGLYPMYGSFGWSLITPLAMVNTLTKLYEGSILTAQDRQLALSLMESIEYDQRFGAGDTAPAGATVAMKNGWVPGPDGLWTTDTSGIIMAGNETYIISVYTQEHSSFPEGRDVLEYVCSKVAALMV